MNVLFGNTLWYYVKKDLKSYYRTSFGDLLRGRTIWQTLPFSREKMSLISSLMKFLIEEQKNIFCHRTNKQNEPQRNQKNSKTKANEVKNESNAKTPQMMEMPSAKFFILSSQSG